MHFKFSPAVLTRLGEELIPNPEQGIIELVKNAYDADARTCTVKFSVTTSGCRSLTIFDDGVGMGAHRIDEGWLMIGSSKKANRSSTALGRLPVGDKGLGRLAALRQGDRVTLKTRPVDEPGVEYVLSINWKLFDKARTVEEVSFTPQKHHTKRKPGSDIVIHDLRRAYGRKEVERLARELILLADPFDDALGFRPTLIAPEFSDIEQQVRHAYFEDAEYCVTATLDQQGCAEAWLTDWQGRSLAHAAHDELTKMRYRTPEARFQLWVFLLNSQTFSTRKSSVSQVREWLSVVGGVHIYHRGLRVKPYGDRDNDWLEMNLARVRSPEERPSTNTSIGRVTVIDPSNKLVQKTDRIGFIEDDAFLELRRFAIDALAWMAKVRLREAEKKREQARKASPQHVEDAKVQIDKIIAENVPLPARSNVEQAVREYEIVRDREVRALREDLQLYRTLATAGVTSAVFAHQTSKPLTSIGRYTNLIEGVGRRLLGNDYAAALEKPVAGLRQSAEALKSHVLLPLHLLRRNKRRFEVVNAHDVVDGVVTLFQPFLDDADIDVRCDLLPGEQHIYGSVALLEAILANMLMNAINAFTEVDGARLQGRQVVIRTELAGQTLLLRVMDNGLGIAMDLEEIWMPGKTTIDEGTGFGLTIVKDSVADLNGKVYAKAHGKLGGAEFIVELPLTKG